MGIQFNSLNRCKISCSSVLFYYSFPSAQSLKVLCTFDLRPLSMGFTRKCDVMHRKFKFTIKCFSGVEITFLVCACVCVVQFTLWKTEVVVTQMYHIWGQVVKLYFYNCSVLDWRKIHLPLPLKENLME